MWARWLISALTVAVAMTAVFQHPKLKNKARKTTLAVHKNAKGAAKGEFSIAAKCGTVRECGNCAVNAKRGIALTTKKEKFDIVEQYFADCPTKDIAVMCGCTPQRIDQIAQTLGIKKSARRRELIPYTRFERGYPR